MVSKASRHQKLTAREFLGAPMPDGMKGHPTLLVFFWAHWCPDCKAQAPILGELSATIATPDSLVVRTDASLRLRCRWRRSAADRELAHIEQIRQRFYSVLPRMAVPVSDADALDTAWTRRRRSC